MWTSTLAAVGLALALGVPGLARAAVPQSEPRFRISVLKLRLYRARVSEPLLDRIHLHVEVPAVTLSELRALAGEPSATVAARVAAASTLIRGLGRSFTIPAGKPAHAWIGGGKMLTDRQSREDRRAKSFNIAEFHGRVLPWYQDSNARIAGARFGRRKRRDRDVAIKLSATIKLPPYPQDILPK